MIRQRRLPLGGEGPEWKSKRGRHGRSFLAARAVTARVEVVSGREMRRWWTWGGGLILDIHVLSFFKTFTFGGVRTSEDLFDSLSVFEWDA